MQNDLDDITKENKKTEDQTEYNNNIENNVIIPKDNTKLDETLQNEDADSDGISDDFTSVDDYGERG